VKRARRQLNVFSLSFLDCICCAFGALILLFVLSEFAPPAAHDDRREALKAERSRLEQQMAELRGETRTLKVDLAAKTAQIADGKQRLARLAGDLSAIEGQFQASRDDAAVQNRISGQLARARQELTEEMRRLLTRRPPETESRVGGIPVDSEYIVFIIDTSGSMKRHAWALVQKKMRETLKLYPKVKGIQVMNDMGEYMFSQYSGKWIPDTPSRRSAIMSRLATWEAFSNSSPVEGITEAIRRFYSLDKKISLYIFGDEFSGGESGSSGRSMQSVVADVDRLNRADESGTRRVRIHAVGFPVVMENTNQPGNTGERFATLMRVLCHRNGGTFVGLNATRP
jgi:hypothetical protein